MRVIGTWTRLFVEARCGFQVVVHHVRWGGGQNFQSHIQTATEVGQQHLNLGARAQFADGFDAIGKMASATVAQVVAVNRGNHHVFQFQCGHGFSQVFWLIRVEWVRTAMTHIAEWATAGTNVTHDHEGCRAFAEALANIWARGFFADWTVRHPDNENGELLQHCGPWPISVAKEKPSIGYPLAFDHPGAVEAEAKHGDMTLCRFDGDNGEYSLLLGHAKGIDGPYTKGTYVWVEVENLKRLEAKVVEGPYIHHCVGIHKDVVPVLYEACKYIGIKPDLYDPIEEEVKAYLRGE